MTDRSRGFARNDKSRASRFPEGQQAAAEEVYQSPRRQQAFLRAAALSSHHPPAELQDLGRRLDRRVDGEHGLVKDEGGAWAAALAQVAREADEDLRGGRADRQPRAGP